MLKQMEKNINWSLGFRKRSYKSIANMNDIFLFKLIIVIYMFLYKLQNLEKKLI